MFAAIQSRKEGTAVKQCGMPDSQPAELTKEAMPTRVLLSSMRGPPESPLQTPLPSLESMQI